MHNKYTCQNHFLTRDDVVGGFVDSLKLAT